MDALTTMMGERAVQDMNHKEIIYLLFSLFVVLVSWEKQQAEAVASLHQEVSQEEAIRLRILANSDSVADQIVKRQIRDRVNDAISRWVGELDNLVSAKAEIAEKLPQLEKNCCQGTGEARPRSAL